MKWDGSSFAEFIRIRQQTHTSINNGMNEKACHSVGIQTPAELAELKLISPRPTVTTELPTSCWLKASDVKDMAFLSVDGCHGFFRET